MWGFLNTDLRDECLHNAMDIRESSAVWVLDN